MLDGKGGTILSGSDTGTSQQSADGHSVEAKDLSVNLTPAVQTDGKISVQIELEWSWLEDNASEQPGSIPGRNTQGMRYAVTLEDGQVLVMRPIVSGDTETVVIMGVRRVHDAAPEAPNAIRNEPWTVAEEPRSPRPQVVVDVVIARVKQGELAKNHAGLFRHFQNQQGATRIVQESERQVWRDLLDQLEQAGKALAVRPSVTSTSGCQATLVSGGEALVPRWTPEGVVADYVPFGTTLNILPVVQADGVLDLEVEWEISELTPHEDKIVQGVRIPAISRYGRSHKIALGPGQTLIAANERVGYHKPPPWFFGLLKRPPVLEDFVTLITPRLAD